MRKMKVDGEIMELPERFPDHPYFRSQAWHRQRNCQIYGKYVAEEKITLEQLGQFWAISRERTRQIILKIARIIIELEAGDPYYGCTANFDEDDCAF